MNFHVALHQRFAKYLLMLRRFAEVLVLSPSTHISRALVTQSSGKHSSESQVRPSCRFASIYVCLWRCNNSRPPKSRVHLYSTRRWMLGAWNTQKCVCWNTQKCVGWNTQKCVGWNTQKCACWNTQKCVGWNTQKCVGWNTQKCVGWNTQKCVFWTTQKCVCWTTQKCSFFKKNVRYPVWICRDPMSLILGTRFSNVGTESSPSNTLKKLHKCVGWITHSVFHWTTYK